MPQMILAPADGPLDALRFRRPSAGAAVCALLLGFVPPYPRNPNWYGALALEGPRFLPRMASPSDRSESLQPFLAYKKKIRLSGLGRGVRLVGTGLSLVRGGRVAFDGTSWLRSSNTRACALSVAVGRQSGSRLNDEFRPPRGGGFWIAASLPEITLGAGCAQEEAAEGSYERALCA